MVNRWIQWTRILACALSASLVTVPGLWAAEAKTRIAIQDGMTVQMNYTLTVDGQMVDSSEGKPPLSYIQGKGQIIPGLERELTGLHVGDKKEVTVAPVNGYGAVDPKALIVITRDKLPPAVDPKVGMMVQGTSQDGQPIRAKIQKVDGENVTLDLNHPLAGKTLQFKIEVISISPAKS